MHAFNVDVLGIYLLLQSLMRILGKEIGCCTAVRITFCGVTTKKVQALWAMSSLSEFHVCWVLMPGAEYFHEG